MKFGNNACAKIFFPLVLLSALLLNCGGEENTVTLSASQGVEAPALTHHNKAVAPTSLFIYNVENTTPYSSPTPSWTNAFRGYVDKAKETGVSYISFEVYLHSAMFETATMPTTTAGYGGELDFTNLDSFFDYAQQQGVYVLPTLWLSKPPEWWEAQNPGAMQQTYDGLVDDAASFNNHAYWDVMDAYVSAIINRYQAHPALLGWSPCIGATQENNYGPSYISYPTATSWSDYSPHAKQRFKDWLVATYATDTALRTAWSDTSVSLATAETPTPLDAVTDPAVASNSAGDTRPQMNDWLEFRLTEKGEEWEHFIALIKSLDPYHVLAINPSASIFTSTAAVARSGSADGPEWTRDPRVDLVLTHPRISFNETPGEYNTENHTLYSFIAYARRLSKVATFALEDTGDYVNNGNIESIARIRSISALLASAGGGAGWVQESTGMLPVWSDIELAEIAKYMDLFDPARRSLVSVPQVAMLFDPKSEQADYPLGGMVGDFSRSSDRIKFYSTLYKAGLQVDPIDVAEVLADPHVLYQYKGIIVSNLARLDPKAAQALASYAQSGNGLLVAGRVGIFDSKGNNDYTSLKTLLQLSSDPGEENSPLSIKAWGITATGDALVTGLSGTIDTSNPYYVPQADWSGAGFTILGRASSGGRPAMLLRRNKTVVWFPRIGIDALNNDAVNTLIMNWKSLL